MKTLISIVLLMAILCISGQAYAAWSTDPAVNNAISTATGGQYSPTIVTDGNGGAIITWYDYRSGIYPDIYAQRIDANGNVLWTADGVAISTATGSQYNPTIVSDGSGGAIITWMDNRSGNYDIYAQRIDANGNVLWTADGVAISTATGSQYNPTIASDGKSGAIITWMDVRNGTNDDIYAQRIDVSGVVQWTADGVPISTAANSQSSPTIVTDGNGGAIITWMDNRSGNYDIYAQRIDANGNVLWTADGVAISTATGSQYNPTIASDGKSGAIITWEGDRNGISGDIYAQRIDANGNVLWTADGVPISTAANRQYIPKIVSDGNGGAIITWSDYRGGIYADIYAQRIDANGNVLWTADGAPISTAAKYQDSPTIVSDGSGGAIITWEDWRSGNWDIYAQRIDANGNVLWTADGVAISTAAGEQLSATMVSDGSGGAIITWYDVRNGITNYDIYAQRITIWGALGPQTWFEESDSAITYTGVWSTSSCASCSGGAMKYTSQTGAKANLSFNGTGIKWIATKSKTSGKANVYIDGAYAGTVDLYSSSTQYKVAAFTKTGLAPGNHIITIEFPGKRVSINIDAFEVIL